MVCMEEGLALVAVSEEAGAEARTVRMEVLGQVKVEKLARVAKVA